MARHQELAGLDHNFAQDQVQCWAIGLR
jgi:hypothetical protein